MKGALALRKPVDVPAVLDTSATNVTNAAYVTFVASLAKACSGIQLHNSGAQPLALAIGAAGNEVQQAVIPIGVSILIPIEVAKAARLSLISLGGTEATGIVTASFFA